MSSRFTALCVTNSKITFYQQSFHSVVSRQSFFQDNQACRHKLLNGYSHHSVDTRQSSRRPFLSLSASETAIMCQQQFSDSQACLQRSERGEGFLWTDSRFAAGHLDGATHIRSIFFAFFQTEVDLPEKQYLTTGRVAVVQYFRF